MELDPDELPPVPRLFRPVSVGTCHRQTAAQRFGNKAEDAIEDREHVSHGGYPQGAEIPFTWPGPGLDDSNEVSQTSIYALIPSTQLYRNNLTALSQAYNIYLAAYQGRIFVYVPRSAPTQTISTHPDVQLVNTPSKAGAVVGGYVDPSHPHVINHIITGFMGKEEIVLASYDDGDVVAYYLRDVAAIVFTKSGLPLAASSCPAKSPRPFFHENVGSSAWGLAIHQHSRLIAVSSNRCEVTVFAPALVPSDGKRQNQSQTEQCDCCGCCDNNEARVIRRARTWRIVILLGSLAHNLPNLCFVDDKFGFAEKVCVVDIKGAVWLADIWKAYQPAIRMGPSTDPLLRSEESWPSPSQGWGTLVLPENIFITVKSVQELLGLHGKTFDTIKPNETCSQTLINVWKSVLDLPGNPCVQVRRRPMATQTLTQIPGDDDEHHLLTVQEEASVDESEEESEEEEEIYEDEDMSDDSEAEVMDSEEDIDEAEQGMDEDAVELMQALYNETMFSAVPEDTLLDDSLSSGSLSPSLAAYQSNALAQFAPEDLPLPLQQVFSDLDNALGELSGAVEELQQAISEPDAPACPFSILTDSDPRSKKRAMEDADVLNQGLHCQCHGAGQGFPPQRPDMIYFPHNGQIQQAPREGRDLVRFLRRPSGFNDSVSSENAVAQGRFDKRLYLLRGYEKDLELRSLGKGVAAGGKRELGVICPEALVQTGSHYTWPIFRATNRVSMMVQIPELSLVVIGSPIGRVLLLTPTRLARPVEHLGGILEHGFRLEWVLPTRSDDNTHRPLWRPLHGMAVGPVQGAGHVKGGEARRAAMPRSYRLMLHYRNHDILTFEITREEQTGKVCIV